MALTITIEYESIWKTSFLAGTNTEPEGKKGRKFIATMTELKKEQNRLERSITVDTVMGVLNRLIGDQRKLYQARQDPAYYFQHLESVLTPEHIVEKSIENDELIMLQNLTSGFDKRLLSGVYNESHPAFTDPVFNSVWDIVYQPLEAILAFITSEDRSGFVATPSSHSALAIADQLDEISALKPIDVDSVTKEALDVLAQLFTDIEYSLTASGKFLPRALYCSAMYIALDELALQHDLTLLLSPRGGLAGISKRNFTRTDFLIFYVNGQRKKTFSTPYFIEERVKDKGLFRKKLTTATGVVTVNLPLTLEQAKELVYLIRCAGVGPFKLGKKGVAHLSEMTLGGQSVYTSTGQIVLSA